MGLDKKTKCFQQQLAVSKRESRMMPPRQQPGKPTCVSIKQRQIARRVQRAGPYQGATVSFQRQGQQCALPILHHGLAAETPGIAHAADELPRDACSSFQQGLQLQTPSSLFANMLQRT